MGREGAPEGEEVVQTLRRFAMARDRFEAAVARRHGISHTDLQALDHLSLNDGLTPGELGERMLLSSGAVTALADRLEEHGWLTRERHPSDRRSTLLRLTDRATVVGEQIFGPFGGELLAAADALDETERGSVESFLAEAEAIAAAHGRAQDDARSSG